MHLGNGTRYFSAVHWMVGNVAITALSDGYFEVPIEQFVTGIPVSDIESARKLAHREKNSRIDINAYLVRNGDKSPILVDAGAGKGLVPTAGRLLDTLRAIGVLAEDIRTVLLTHLHGDHCGGLVDENGRASFPNAEVYIASSEHGYWLGDSRTPGLDQGAAALVRAALDPYTSRLRLIEEGEIIPGIHAMSLPGHTPGHTGFQVGNVKQSVFICGDILNVPAVQSMFPNAGVVTDVSPTLAAETRNTFLTRATKENLLVAGMHTEFPGVVQVVAVEDGFRIVPALWSALQ